MQRSVPMAQGRHLFPYRTQKLSLAAVTILGVHPWENSTVPNYKKGVRIGLSFSLFHFVSAKRNPKTDRQSSYLMYLLSETGSLRNLFVTCHGQLTNFRQSSRPSPPLYDNIYSGTPRAWIFYQSSPFFLCFTDRPMWAKMNEWMTIF